MEEMVKFVANKRREIRYPWLHLKYADLQGNFEKDYNIFLGQESND